MLAEFSEPYLPLDMDINHVQVVSNSIKSDKATITDEFVMRTIIDALSDNKSTDKAAMQIQSRISLKIDDGNY